MCLGHDFLHSQIFILKKDNTRNIFEPQQVWVQLFNTNFVNFTIKLKTLFIKRRKEYKGLKEFNLFATFWRNLGQALKALRQDVFKHFLRCTNWLQTDGSARNKNYYVRRTKKITNQNGTTMVLKEIFKHELQKFTQKLFLIRHVSRYFSQVYS